MLPALVFGLLFGFFGSMPLAGPIAILVFGRGLHGRYRSGLSIAAGAALAESAYAFIAYWGLSTLLVRYPVIGQVSHGLAALILLGLGLAFALRRRREAAQEPERERAGGSFVLGFLITALNPTFIATWTAAVATLHATGLVATDASGALPFAAGVCAGIVGWFWLLLEALRRYRDRFRPETLDNILRVVGVVLVVMGLWFGVRFAASLVRS